MGDPQEIYQEKVQAVLFGAALGDAVGLLTELKSETDINEMYPKKTDLVFPSPEPLRGYTLGDWTDETDQLIVVLDTLKDCSSNGRLNNYSKQIFNDPSVKELRLKTDSSNRVHKPVSQLSPEQLFAYKLKYWVTEGFPAIGDDVGKGCESLVHQISTRAGFIKNPIGIAQNIWQRRGKPVTNSCVPRSAAIGLLDDLSTVFKLTERFCLVTHSDPRNVASCVIVSFLIFTFTHHDVPREKIEDVIGLAIQHGKQVLRLHHLVLRFSKHRHDALQRLAGRGCQRHANGARGLFLHWKHSAGNQCRPGLHVFRARQRLGHTEDHGSGQRFARHQCFPSVYQWPPSQ